MVLERLRWLGHASFLVEGDPVIYIDPWETPPGLPAADLILVTHSHYDHLSVPDIERLAKPSTTVVGPADVIRRLGRQRLNLVELNPGDEKAVGGVKIRAVPAYNRTKQFHPRASGWVGFVVYLPEGSIYHAGDTDHIPEMQGLKPTVALLPVGGTYTMDAAEAAQAAADIGPEVAVPMHYGKVVGSEADARRFVQLYSGRAEVLPKGGSR